MPAFNVAKIQGKGTEGEPTKEATIEPPISIVLHIESKYKEVVMVKVTKPLEKKP